MLNLEEKTKVIADFKINAKDTGSPEVQVALLTADILKLQKHFEVNKKDNHSRKGLIAKINKRKSLLAYISKEDATRYTTLIQRLGLRK